MCSIPITPVTHPFHRSIRVPGSKSITNRALPLAALASAESESTLTGVLFADDTLQMIRALQSLGYAMTVDQPNRSLTIRGQGAAIPATQANLHCGNSGTTIRFLAAMLTAAPQGDYTLDGIPRMRQRPIGQLVDQLTTLGAHIDYLAAPGFPPIRIRAAGLAGGPCTFADAQSSQYISAVLMAAPYAREPVHLQLLGPITSEPYVTMTLRMMEQFGIAVAIHDQCGPPSAPPSRTITVPQGVYQPRAYAVEPDASNASYFLAAAALFKDASITIEGLGKDSLQGDVAFANVLQRMGANLVLQQNAITITGTGRLAGLDIDMNAIPDMVQTLAVVALFAQGPTTVRNVANLRVKETDRLAALETELKKLGAAVTTTRDSITINPPAVPTPASIATYDDHRMAMAFAIAGLKIPGVEIQHPECTGKTYPEFFTDLSAAVS